MKKRVWTSKCICFKHIKFVLSSGRQTICRSDDDAHVKLSGIIVTIGMIRALRWTASEAFSFFFKKIKILEEISTHELDDF